LDNAASVVATSVSGSHEVLTGQITISGGGVTTFSTFAKYNGNHLTLTKAYNSTNWTGCVFDLQNGVAKTPQNSGVSDVCTADVEDYGNGWYRCSITFNPFASANQYIISLTDDVNATLGTWGADTYLGDNVSGIYLYGNQVELGSYSTSYIPTYGVSQTRASEINNLATPISLDGDFALFWEGAVFEDDIMLYGSGTNAWYMNFTTSSGRIILDELSGRKVEAYLGSGIPTSVRTKIMIRRQGGVHNVFANGAKLANYISVDSNSTLSLSSMYWGYSSYFYKGLEVNQSLVFETALTDSECIALTTI
jgi:hypothetical protein